MAYRDEEFVLNNMDKVLSALRAAASCDQLFFQLERVFFCAFNRNMSDTLHYAGESISKTLDWRAVARLAAAICEYADEHGLTEELIEVRAACEKLQPIMELFHRLGDRLPDYKDMGEGERAGVNLSTLLEKLILKAFPVMRLKEESPGVSKTT